MWIVLGTHLGAFLAGVFATLAFAAVLNTAPLPPQPKPRAFDRKRDGPHEELFQ